MAYLKEEIKAGTIIVVSVILLTAFSILIGGSNFFEKHDVYYIKVMNAAGLEAGAHVKLGGVRVGKILEIRAPEKSGEKVAITIGLEEGTPLYKGTIAHITQAGFVGDIYLLLAVEETVNEKLLIGDTIPSMDKIDFNVLMAKVNVIAESVDMLVNNIDKLFSQSAIQNIEKAVENAGIALTEISSLVRTTKGETSEAMAKTSNALDKTSKALDKTSEALDKVGDAAKSVERTSDTIEGAVSLQSENLTDLMISISEATADLQEVLQEIKNKPWSIIYKEGSADNE